MRTSTIIENTAKKENAQSFEIYRISDSGTTNMNDIRAAKTRELAKSLPGAAENKHTKKNDRLLQGSAECKMEADRTKLDYLRGVKTRMRSGK